MARCIISQLILVEEKDETLRLFDADRAYVVDGDLWLWKGFKPVMGYPAGWWERWELVAGSSRVSVESARGRLRSP